MKGFPAISGTSPIQKKESFKPHNMYDKKKAETYKEHLELKKKGYSHSPAKQKYVKPLDYWYKVNGKKVTYDQYKKAWKEGVDERRPNLQTNNPDAFGIKAKIAKDRAKLPKKHTVLTEQQTKNLKK